MDHEKDPGYDGSYQSLYTVLPQSTQPHHDADMLLVSLWVAICLLSICVVSFADRSYAWVGHRFGHTGVW